MGHESKQSLSGSHSLKVYHFLLKEQITHGEEWARHNFRALSWGGAALVLQQEASSCLGLTGSGRKASVLQASVVCDTGTILVLSMYQGCNMSMCQGD